MNVYENGNDKRRERETYEGNLALSWFSVNDPRSDASAQDFCAVLIISASSLMLPSDDLKALRAG